MSLIKIAELSDNLPIILPTDDSSINTLIDSFDENRKLKLSLLEYLLGFKLTSCITANCTICNEVHIMEISYYKCKLDTCTNKYCYMVQDCSLLNIQRFYRLVALNSNDYLLNSINTQFIIIPKENIFNISGICNLHDIYKVIIIQSFNINIVRNALNKIKISKVARHYFITKLNQLLDNSINRRIEEWEGKLINICKGKDIIQLDVSVPKHILKKDPVIVDIKNDIMLSDLNLL